MIKGRQIKFHQAILEATDQCLAADSRVYVMGLGVPDPKGIFGTTLGLQQKYGDRRVMDMPTSENGMTGIAIGSAVVGMRPMMIHQRMDFMLLSLDQIINNAAKWHFMFGGKMSVPLVIRLVVGRGWGQGPQHSQSLHVLFAHIPGLKVVIPATPYDAKGLLIAAIEDDNPVIYIEHRWLHDTYGDVPREMYRIPLGKARTIRPGSDITIVASSYSVVESLKAAEILDREGIKAEVINMMSVRPFDGSHVVEAVGKTRRLLAVESGWMAYGLGAEIIATVAEQLSGHLLSAPARIAYPEAPTPTSWPLAKHYYPRVIHIVNEVQRMLGRPKKTEEEIGISAPAYYDVPYDAFSGPF